MADEPAPDPLSLSVKDRRKQLIQLAVAAMTSNPERWWGPLFSGPAPIVPGEIVPLLAKTPAGVVYGSDAGLRAGGLRFVEATDGWLDAVESVLAQASFFDRYWLAVKDDAQMMMQIYDQLQECGVRNVGLLSLQEGHISMMKPIQDGESAAVLPALKDAIRATHW